MNTLIHIGFGNIVNTEKIIAVVSPDSAPVKGWCSMRGNRGWQSMLPRGENEVGAVMENSQLVLSALLPETIANRRQTESGEINET